MYDTILSTKLFIPNLRDDHVPRHHLVEILNAGGNNRLILISAPAGFGKTSLICEWISQCNLPFGWISLDENDNDPGRFLSYITASLQSIGIETDIEPINMIQSPGKIEIEPTVNSLINQITEVQIACGIVLDDYHYIRNQDIHHIVSYLLEHLPPNIRVVIGTRADPSFPIALLRARGQLTEIRSADLRFNVSEGEELLNQVNKLGLKNDDIGKLISRTDGWIAGLQLATIALKGQREPSDYIQHFSGSQDYIVDFLTTEVLNQQPHQIQEFLFKTAILNRLTASLCEYLTGFDDCNHLLLTLRKGNTFLQPLDDEHQWYTYHRLFRDLLMQQMMEKHAAEIPDLYLKACTWSEEHGSINDAVDYAIQGQHYEKAADLVETQAEPVLLQSEITTFIGWVEKLPRTTVYARPNLCIYYSWALLVSKQTPEIAEEFINHVSTGNELILGKYNSVRSILAAFRRNVPEAIKLARDALDQLPENETFFRQITAWNLSAALFLNDEMDESMDVLEDVTRVSITSGNRMVAIVTLCRLGGIKLQQGKLTSAHSYYQRALNVALEDRETPLPAACEAYLGMGKIHWEWYQFDQAKKMLSEGITLSKRWREAASIEGRINLAHLLVSQGNHEGALEIIAETKKITHKNIFTETGSQYVALQDAHLQFRMGNLSAAKSWAEERGLGKTIQEGGFEESGITGADLICSLELLVYSRLLINEKKFQESLTNLSKLLPFYTKLDHRAKIIETQILQGICQNFSGMSEAAIESVKSALELGVQEKFRRVFIDEFPSGSKLVKKVGTFEDGSDFLLEILSAWKNNNQQANEILASTPIIEELSERELEILRYLNSEVSIPEIASNIHISVSTLRTHIRNIYRKLDTHSRFETVTKAKELEII